MPRIDDWPVVLHTTCAEEPIRSSGLVIRHTNAFHAPDRFRGRLLTTPARTVVDLARTTTLFNAVAAADYAVRVELCAQDELWEEVRDVPPRSRGRRQAELVADLADARVMSPGESLSRCQMFLLNLPRPELQAQHRDDEGLIGYVDFQWDGLVGEFDGKVKYKVPPEATPDQASQILWAEKRREDRLRARGQKVARWVYADAINPARWLPGSPSRG